VRLLITGATGFIGRHLVAYLARTQPHAELFLLLREGYAAGQPLPAPLLSWRSRFTPVYADLRNFNLTQRAVLDSQPDAVLHLAAAGVGDPFLPAESALRHNVTGALNLLRASFEKCATVGRVIVGRTPGEALALNVYAASKAAAWDFCRMYTRTAGWPIQGAMLFQCYGRGQPDHALVPASIRAALAGRDFPMTSGRPQRDWVHVGDVVEGLAAMVAAPLAPGITVELGTGRATSILEVVETIYRLAGRGGRPLAGALPDRPAEAEAERQVADAATAQRLIAWRAKTNLVDGLVGLLQETLSGDTIAHDNLQ
jgi:nucleoside-diphosphate-sugar epimerase